MDMRKLKEQLEILEENLAFSRFPEEERFEICSCYALRESYYQCQAKRAYDGAEPDFPICVKSPLNRLVIWCCKLPEVRRKYQAMGIPEKVIQDTVGDIALRAAQYRKKNGVPGLSKEDVIWFRHLNNGEIFQIGGLQYQLFHMVYLDKEGCGEDYMQFSMEQKSSLPQGTPVLNVHIPVGADISPASIHASFSAVKQFFAEHFPDFGAKAFLCYSWLLYPGMLEILPEKSNIAAFASNFKLIGQVQDPYGSDAVKRIYGRRFPRRREYPQETRLQRNALGNFSKLGMACGVIEIT